MAATPGKLQDEFDEKLFKAYEDGKHRRYNLLFAVNGGAFAVAKLLGEKGTAAVGNLTIGHLAVGMVFFTAVMSFDILTFGLKMRKQWKESVPDLQKTPVREGLFALPGWIVLAAIWLLLSFGWLLVGLGPRTEDNVMQEEIRQLAALNQEIGAAENAGDLKRLGEIAAPFLAFRRRDGSIVDRDAFLQTPKPGKRETRLDSIHVYGNRAVVTCVVTDAGVATHNIRMFVKEEGNWRLLGWANEPNETGPATRHPD